MTKKTKKQTLILLTKKKDQILPNYKVQDLVHVKSGFARNYLLPKNFAILADEKILSQQKQKQKNLDFQQEQRIKKCTEFKIKLENFKTFELEKRIGNTNKIFGKITPKQIFEVLSTATGLSFSDAKMSCPDIKELGIYPVDIILHPKVIASIQLQILPK